MKLTIEQIDLIKKPLPKEAISPHPTKPYLSSIKAIYVTERLNEVFGIGAWTIKVNEISVNDKGMAVVKVILEIPEYNIYYESFGGNDNGGAGSKNFDLGDAYKGATTDAITKICSYIGIGIDVFKGKQKSDNTIENKEQIKWYNDVDKHLEAWRNAIIQKKATPQEIIDKIEADGYKLNKANKDKILNLF